MINEGTVTLFRPVSDEARAFFEDHVDAEPYQWLGDSIAVEHRYADNLAIGLATEGFIVEA